MTKTHKTIAVDFDGTLADDSRVKYPDLGPPIPTMVERVRGWIQDGHTVKIFTARLAQKDRDAEKQQVKALTEWLDLINLTQKDGRPLVLTATKLPEFDEFWDDKAVGVIRNTGSTYFESEHYRDNYDPKSGMWGATKEESSRPRNEAQLELQFGTPGDEGFYSSDPSKLHPHVREYRRMRGDYDTPVTLEEKLSALPADRQDRINSRAEALIKQQLTALGPFGQERVGDAGLYGGQSRLPSGTVRMDFANEGCAPYTAYITYKDLTGSQAPSLGPIGQAFEAWRRAAENIPEDPFIDPREPYTR
jgi:hypothetical protein